MQLAHDKLSVFGVGAELNEKQWRTVMRQLVALGHLQPDSEAFGALKLSDSARGILKGESAVMLREETAAGAARRQGQSRETGRCLLRPGGTTKPAGRTARLAVGDGAQGRCARLREADIAHAPRAAGRLSMSQ